MLSFMGQSQLGKLDKLATFACQKRIRKTPIENQMFRKSETGVPAGPRKKRLRAGTRL